MFYGGRYYKLTVISTKAPRKNIPPKCQRLCHYFLTSGWINGIPIFLDVTVSLCLFLTSGDKVERVDCTAQSHTVLYNPMTCLWCTTTSDKETIERKTPSMWWAKQHNFKLQLNN